MDTNKDRVSDYSTPLLRNAPKKTCPKCKSVFVTEKECEGCGYQIGHDRLGEPFGEKSFFNLREEFNHQFRWKYFLAKRGHLLTDKMVKKYQRIVLKRFEVLCNYYFNEQDESRERRKLFLYEGQMAIRELLSLKVPKSYLYIMLEKGEDHPFFEILSKELNIHEDVEPSILSYIATNIPTSLRSFPSWGVLLQFGVGAGSVVIAAFLVMKYLTAVN